MMELVAGPSRMMNGLAVAASATLRSTIRSGFHKQDMILIHL